MTSKTGRWNVHRERECEPDFGLDAAGRTDDTTEEDSHSSNEENK